MRTRLLRNFGTCWWVIRWHTCQSEVCWAAEKHVNDVNVESFRQTDGMCEEREKKRLHSCSLGHSCIPCVVHQRSIKSLNHTSPLPAGRDFLAWKDGTGVALWFFCCENICLMLSGTPVVLNSPYVQRKQDGPGEANLASGCYKSCGTDNRFKLR